MLCIVQNVTVREHCTHCFVPHFLEYQESYSHAYYHVSISTVHGKVLVAATESMFIPLGGGHRSTRILEISKKHCALSRKHQFLKSVTKVS